MRCADHQSALVRYNQSALVRSSNCAGALINLRWCAQAGDERALELEIGPRQGRGFAVHALGPDSTMGAETVPGPATPDASSNDMEIVTTEEAVPEPSAAPKAVGTTISVSDSDEDNWGEWRPARAGPATPDAARGASIPEPATPPATWQQPPMELDDRYATELQEAISSNVEVLQVKLEAGKAARSTKLWLLLRQSMSKFQRGQDLVHLIEVKQMGASAGYELWRSLNNELSVRSRVEGQALREQALGLVPPKHLKRPLDVARWYTTELLKFEAQVKHRFPELLIGEQEGVLCLMKHLDAETKRYLLLHHSTKSMGELMTGLQFYDEQLRVMDFQREGASGYANAFKGGKGGKGDRDKSNKGSKGSKGNKGEKGEKGQKGGKAKGKDRKGDRGGKGDRARSKSREAKKTDVCRNCGKTGHWARDCWAPSKDKAAAATSQAVTTQPEAPSSSSSTSAKAAAQPTTKGSGKAQSSIKTFLEGYHFGMMLTNQVVSFPSDDRIYWLIDSGSSFHIITRETLESDHVKILSWLEGRPKSYAETATGDSVEIGGSTHVLVEVCFETTTPASSKSSSEHESDAVYMCKARFEAVISDQIKHNLLNINLLCQNGGWEPTLCVQQGGITVRKHGVTLKPTLFASVSWLASVRSDHPLALKLQDLIAKTEQHRKNRSRKSSADRDFHRSTSNRGHRNSARVCVEPKNPELLDISCLDEMSDCKGHVSHEHADLDQGETKEKLRAVDELLGAAPSPFESVSHADMPVFH